MQDATHDEAPLLDDPWRSPLDELERTLSEVGRALSALRGSLESGGAIPRIDASPSEPTGKEPQAAADAKTAPAGFQAVWQRVKRVGHAREGGGPDAADAAAGSGFSEPPALESDYELNDEARAVGKSRLSSFEGVWERLERERKERSEGDIEEIAEVRGLEHLPQTYRITVEDRDGTPVDLVTIHRALLTFAAADDISLINFANGVPIVSIRVEGELDLERLAAAISAATSRQCEVIPQDKGKLFLRLSSEEGNKG